MATERECVVEPCDRPRYGRLEYCRSHHMYWNRTGRRPTHRIRSVDATPIERFMAKVDKTGDCWLWTAGRNASRYGKFGVQGSGSVLAHRWAYEHFVGPIPDGLELDHLCRVRHCVNPAHLEPVTTRENGQRSPIHNGSKTHCKRGHEFTPENTRHNGAGRVCRICARLRSRSYKRRKALL